MSRPAPLDILAPSDPPVRVEAPAGGARCPLVFASPHSGRGAPLGFLSLLRPPASSLRRSEDAYVDRLFASVPRFGAPLVSAAFSRAFVDANREPAEIDGAMLDEPLPPWANGASPRVSNGLGVIPRLTADGETIHRRRLSLAEMEARIARFHAPYHRALALELEAARQRHGFAILIDCHSMPAAPDCGGGPDIVLGDRFGAACDPRVMDRIERVFQDHSFSVQRNVPFAGGYTTVHYGRPRMGAHAIQVELSRALYLDEAAVAPLPGRFMELASRLESVVAELVAQDWTQTLSAGPAAPRLAAE